MPVLNEVLCPHCGLNTSTAVYIETQCSIRIPVRDGAIRPAEELLRAPQYPSFIAEEDPNQLDFSFMEDGSVPLKDNPQGLFRYCSSNDGEMIINLYTEEETTARLYCPRCGKFYRLDKVPEYIEEQV